MSDKMRTVLSHKTTIILASALLIACVAVAAFSFSPLHATKAASADTILCGQSYPTLSYGSTGGWVKSLQFQFNLDYQFGLLPNSPYNFHPKLAEDGIFGANTLAAVKDYQTKHKSEVKYVDGIVGPLTWKSIVGGCIVNAFG